MSRKGNCGAAAGVVLFCLTAAVLGVIWRTSRPQTAPGEKHITVEVIHSGGSRAEFSYDTDEEYLGAVLVSEGLISGSEGMYGLYVETVDGETADYGADNGWWRLSCNGEDSLVGADAVVINDGDRFTWIYTAG